MAENEDDLLDPSEIEALLKAAGGGDPETPAKDKKSGGGSGAILDPSDIDALLAEEDSSSGQGSHRTEDLLNEAEANLAAAIASDFGQGSKKRGDTSGATPFSLNNLHPIPGAEERGELNLLQDVELDLRIELGRAELQIEEVVSLKAGSVVPLDKLAGDPVDILVNGRLVARGEVLVLNDNFCVRVAEILAPQR
ncbi:flagellar motor switch protein FliN [Rubinisphaera margarita]|uniref:flagellar motor switch protein FliN n=1 Tax=Rubinisphaera margarita TaxID=2909586 RepID=UPI001EE8E4AD|nr:flagellar motor switch protein FliN [Rubinisphaera margarita]MCG6154517.1 flagellar motor switch protein FliN [Rubinisphaera margarita]